MQRLLSKGQNLCHLTKQLPGSLRAAHAMRWRPSRRLCFNTRVFFGVATEAGTLVSSPVGPFGELSETRGEACDASQILSDRAENHKRVLFTKLVDA